MAEFEQVKQDYNAQSANYDDYVTRTPIGVLETQLFETALGSSTPGAKILDLGGGTGEKARIAFALGAKSVDLVDISAGMIRTGQDMENALGFGGGDGSKARIAWYEADVSQPLDQQALSASLQPASYDIVLGCWIFGHADTNEKFHGMWQNVAKYLKPTGLFVGVRGGRPRALSMSTGKYGCTVKDFKEIPGGWRYKYILHTEPLLSFDYAGLDLVWSRPFEVPRKYGMVDLEEVPIDSAEVVKADPDFFKDFVDDPGMIIFRGRKSQ